MTAVDGIEVDSKKSITIPGKSRALPSSIHVPELSSNMYFYNVCFYHKSFDNRNIHHRDTLTTAILFLG